jgi:anti-anti-sigma factor
MGELYSIHVDSHDGTTTIRLRGEIDLAADRELRAVVSDSILSRPPPDRLEIDLVETTFLGSTGLNALVLAHHATGFVGAVLHVTSAAPNVMRVLQLSGLRFLNLGPAPRPLISAG